MAVGYAYAILGDFQLAEDAAQQAFVTAYCRLKQLERPERFDGWPRGIVRFECLPFRRRRRLAHVPLESAAAIVSSSPGPAQTREAQEGPSS